jgi:hypothetical protein
METGIRGRHQARAPDDIEVPIEGTEDAPGFTNARRNRCDVPRTHSRINRHVNTALAQQNVIDAIARPAESSSLAIESRKAD